VGLIVPFVALMPLWIYSYLATEITMAPAVILGLGTVFGLIPTGFYATGYLCGRRWPDTSPWSWSAFIVGPFALLCLSKMMIPGLLFILPPYFGAKRGRKRWAEPTNKGGA